MSDLYSTSVEKEETDSQYLASVASELLDRQRERAGDPSRLRAALGELEKARLAAETTLGRESMTEAKRKWLRANRPPAAGHWNVLTMLSAGTVDPGRPHPDPLPPGEGIAVKWSQS